MSLYADKGLSPPIPFNIGDKVKTDFYNKDKHLIRTVVKVFVPMFHCESGWFVHTIDTFGRHLKCDSNWYKKC